MNILITEQFNRNV